MSGVAEIDRGPARRPTASPFQQLERQARRLRAFFVGLVVTIALLPTMVFVILEIGHLRTHAEQSAARIAALLTEDAVAARPGAATLSARIWEAMQAHSMVAMRLIGPDGVEMFRVGDLAPWSAVSEVGVALGPAAAPFSEVRVVGNDYLLPWRIARVLAIHLVVASVLALIGYHLPMRALRLAISEGERTYAQLLHADRLITIGEMYAGLSHEINNPLGIVLANARFLLSTARERGLPADLVEEIELIDRNGTRVADIIRGLLAFARKASFELKETDLNGVIEEVVSLLQGQFAKQGVRIQWYPDASIPSVQASPEHLQQVFVNLLNNARDAMPQGGAITLRTRMNGREVLAEVEDSGPGVAPDVEARIFEPFFTTKPLGKGTGMGLAVSYGIVRTHGGDITLASGRGGGALFRLRLPVGGRS